MSDQQQSPKQARLKALAKKIAQIVHEDVQANGPLKPSATSPKFWVHVQRELDKLKDKNKTDEQSGE